MNLSEALRLINEGKMIRRASWSVRDVRIVGSVPSATKLRRECHTETDRNRHPCIVAAFSSELDDPAGAPAWQPTPEDLLAHDYELYTSPDAAVVDLESTGFDGQGLQAAVAGEVA